MYINSEFLLYDLENKNTYLYNSIKYEYEYENSLNNKLYNFYLYLENIFNFSNFKLKISSNFFSNFFSKYYKVFKIKFKHKIKIKRKRRKKFRKIPINKFYLKDVISPISTSFWQKRKKWLRIKKVSIIRPMKTILRSRRILRFLFSSFKIKSKKLTTKLLQFFANKTLFHSKMIFQSLGCILLRSKLILNLKDIYFFLKNNLIEVNNKIVRFFFKIINPGDVIKIKSNLFLINYFWYFKFTSNRWLKRKKKKNLRRLKKYINFNKSSTRINVIVRRWLSKTQVFSSKYSNFEVDYKLMLILVFSNSCLFFKKNLFNSFLKSIGILNVWYYKF